MLFLHGWWGSEGPPRCPRRAGLDGAPRLGPELGDPLLCPGLGSQGLGRCALELPVPRSERNRVTEPSGVWEEAGGLAQHPSVSPAGWPYSSPRSLTAEAQEDLGS